MLLQPIVENAIKYGVSKSRKAVLIRIEARHLDNHRMVLEISNRLKHGGKDELPAATHEGTGLGLANVCQRLKVALGQPRQLPLRSDDERRLQSFTDDATGNQCLNRTPLRDLDRRRRAARRRRLQLLMARAEGAHLVARLATATARSTLRRHFIPICFCSTSPCPGSTELP